MGLAARVHELLLQGYCCSQIIMELGLLEMQKENKELVTAMQGLCHGMHAETVCGTLSASSCLLFLLSESHGLNLIKELTAWFEEEFGSIDCPALLGDDPPEAIRKLCPVIICSTFEEVLNLAGRHGLSWSWGALD